MKSQVGIFIWQLVFLLYGLATATSNYGTRIVIKRRIENKGYHR